jgi:hypothetical protein
MSGVVTSTIAVVAIATAATEVAAVGITIGSVLAITAAVGATVAAVGAFTGDQTLQTIGMVVGAVGAIGSIANSANLLGGVGDMFGGGVAEGVVEGVTAAETASPFTTQPSAAQGLVEGVTAAETASPFIAQPSAAPTEVTAEALSKAVTGLPEGFVSQEHAASIVPGAVGQGDAVPFSFDTVADAVGNLPSPATTTAAPVVQSAPATGQPAAPPATPSTPQAAPVPTNAPPATPATPAAATTGVAALPSADALINGPNLGGITKADGSGLAGVMDFLKNNQMLAYGALQAGSSFFAGAFGGSDNEPSEAQIQAWQAQANANNAQANYQNLIASNLASGNPMSNKQAGLINQAGTAVTGVPA